MGTNNELPIASFYHDRPVFGLDIGFSSIKVMQIEHAGKKHHIRGYGVRQFPSEAIQDGVIVDYEAIAKATHELFSDNIIGAISTRRVVMAIPAARAFTRSVSLPKLDKKDLDAAVTLEAEQYIPVPIDDLYIDYSIVRQNADDQDILAMAVPKKIIASYQNLTNILGLELVGLETTLSASSRLFAKTEDASIPSVLIDFGSLSTDITIFDGNIVVTGTVTGGGDSFTASIADALNISKQEAHIVKTKYGLGVSKKQKEITDATRPILDQLGKEIKRMIRYYEERFGGSRKIDQIITMGGGANMPGVSTYLTDILRVPVKLSSPWDSLNFGSLQPPNKIEKTMYITVAGLSLVEPKELF